MITDKELLDFYKRGLIPGPREDENVFLQRVSKALPLAPKLDVPKFGITIDWMPILYSNKKLPFWEGAATWIDGNGLPSIQLREGFQKGSYLGYQRDEVLAHEAVHAARSTFEEPKFEEALAYMTSKSRFRRWLGPLFRRSWESALLIVALFLGMLTQIWIPIVLIGYFLMRLIKTHWCLRRCLKKFPPSVVMLMTDKEIVKVFTPKTGLRGRLFSNLIRDFQ